MRKNQRGSALFLVLIIFATLFALLGISLERDAALFTRIQRNHLKNAALNLAEAGVQYSIHQLVHTGKPFQGEKEITLDTGTFSTSVSPLSGSGKVEIFSVGKTKGKGQIGEVVKTLKVLVELTSKDSQQAYIIHSWEEVS